MLLVRSIEATIDRTPLTVTRRLRDRRDQGVSLVAFSMLQKVERSQKKGLVEFVCSISSGSSSCIGDRAVGSLVGLAVGDWVGVPLEFLPVVGKPSSDSPQWVPETFTYTNLPKIKEAERGEMKMGQWSDDTSMALCLADSIILNSGYSGSDVRKRFWNWQAEGLNNCFRNDTTRDRRVSFGLGYNIANSLLSMEPGVEPMACFESDSEDSGNGSLMRLAPVPIFFSCSTEAELKDLLLTAALSSMATHPGALASESCQFLAFLIMKAIQGPPQESAKQFMDSVTAEYLSLIQVRKSDIFGKPYSEQVLKSMTELITSSPSSASEACWNWKNPELPIEETLVARGEMYNGYRVSKGYFGSFCMDGLAMALHSVYHTKSFSEAITKAVNFLGDADSVGAIAGQLAGAIYGFSTFKEYHEPIVQWDDDDISCRAALLYLIGAEKSV